jgi:hypothetical protein
MLCNKKLQLWPDGRTGIKIMGWFLAIEMGGVGGIALAPGPAEELARVISHRSALRAVLRVNDWR